MASPGPVTTAPSVASSNAPFSSPSKPTEPVSTSHLLSNPNPTPTAGGSSLPSTSRRSANHPVSSALSGMAAPAALAEARTNTAVAATGTTGGGASGQATLSGDEHSEGYADAEEAEGDGSDEEELELEREKMTEEVKNQKEMFNERTIKSGYLMKKGEKRKNWKKRWFVLRSSKLGYYKNEKEYQLLRLLDMSEVHTVAAVEIKRVDNTFGIVTPKRTYYVKARSRADMEEWIHALNEVKEQIAQRSTITQQESGGDRDDVPTSTIGEEQHDPTTPTTPMGIAIPRQGFPPSATQQRAPGGLGISPRSNLSPISEPTSASGEGEEEEHEIPPFGLSYANTTAPTGSPGSTSVLERLGAAGLVGKPASDFGSGDDQARVHHHRRDSQHSVRGSSAPGVGGAAGAQQRGSVCHRSPSSGGGHELSAGSSGGDPGSPYAGASSSDEEDLEPIEGEEADILPPFLPPPLQGQAGSGAEQQKQVLSLDPHKVIIKGYLMKQSSKRRSWRKRWFVLTSTQLAYMRSHMDAKPHRQIPLTSILDAIEYESKKAAAPPLSPSAFTSPQLPHSADPHHAGSVGAASSSANATAFGTSVGSSTGILSGSEGAAGQGGPGVGHKRKKENCFKIITPKRTFLLCAPTEEEEIKWLSALQTLLRRERAALGPATPVAAPPGKSTSAHTQSPQLANPSGAALASGAAGTRPAPTAEAFQLKLPTIHSPTSPTSGGGTGGGGGAPSPTEGRGPSFAQHPPNLS